MYKCYQQAWSSWSDIFFPEGVICLKVCQAWTGGRWHLESLDVGKTKRFQQIKLFLRSSFLWELCKLWSLVLLSLNAVKNHFPKSVRKPLHAMWAKIKGCWILFCKGFFPKSETLGMALLTKNLTFWEVRPSMLRLLQAVLIVECEKIRKLHF